jgi:hypothetical protein
MRSRGIDTVPPEQLLVALASPLKVKFKAASHTPIQALQRQLDW